MTTTFDNAYNIAICYNTFAKLLSMPIKRPLHEIDQFNKCWFMHKRKMYDIGQFYYGDRLYYKVCKKCGDNHPALTGEW